MPDPVSVDHNSYPDSYIREILRNVRSIAMVGASATWNRPSNFVMKYLLKKGFKVIPVNPVATVTENLWRNGVSGFILHSLELWTWLIFFARQKMLQNW